MLKFQVVIILALIFAFPCQATLQESSIDEKMEAGNYTIKVNNTRVRLEPSYKGKITNTLHKGTKVYVYEFKSGWARVSKWYSGSVEGVVGDQMTGLVARWVPARLVSRKN
jgi:uncharacterized protein YgiM (DUF1202 family)|tara:strand:- start:1488 stop:1820 length:333 start_codon:yes stop_codon:yes gene_type:complete